MQKGWLRITDDFVVMPIEEAQPRVEHGAVVQGCEAKEEVGWIGDGGGLQSVKVKRPIGQHLMGHVKPNKGTRTQKAMTIFPVYTNLVRHTVSIFPTSKSFARYKTHILKERSTRLKVGRCGQLSLLDRGASQPVGVVTGSS